MRNWITRIMTNLTIASECVLGYLFPPKLPKIAYYTDLDYEEQGSCGIARIRKFRDALDRMQQERA